MTLVDLQTSIPIETLRPLSSAFFLPIHTAYIERINKLPWLLLYLIKTGLFFRDQDKIYILFPPETETLPGSPPPSLSGNLDKVSPRDTLCIVQDICMLLRWNDGIVWVLFQKINAYICKLCLQKHWVVYMSEPSSHKHTSIFNSHAQQSELKVYYTNLIRW